VGDNGVTDQLVCTQYGFAIPAGATILGIVIDVERRTNDVTAISPTRDASMRVLKAGVAQAAERATTTDYTLADVVEGHGGATDLWGTTWSVADINNANFGARFQAQKAGATGGNVQISVDHMPITVYWVIAAFVATPENFNAVDVAADAITGKIQTKVAGGGGFSLDVVAISGGAQMTGFSNTVTVELLGNATLGVALDAQNCPTSFTSVQTVSPNPALSGGRATVNFAAVPAAWRDVRVRMTYNAVIACSADNFAIRPSALSVTVTDADWSTAGSSRVLDTLAAPGGRVHKAGQPFTVNVTHAGYNGDPTVSALACLTDPANTTLPSTCNTGTLSLGAFSSSGSVRSASATYSEAGAVNLTLIDQTFAAVDASDGTPATCAGQYICQSAALGVGRFVPDHFVVATPSPTPPLPPQFRTFGVADAACSGSRSFTYVGQQFGYVDLPLAKPPIAEISARNAAGGPTENYRGPLWKLTTAGLLSQTFSNPGQTIDTSLNAPTFTEIADGKGTVTASLADRISVRRDNALASAPFDANLSLAWRVQDPSENGVAGQGIIDTPTPYVFNGTGSGIEFDAGAQFRYGRLRLRNANGSQLTKLPIVVEAQYAVYTNPPTNTVLSFVTNAADNCTAIANNNVALSSFGGQLAACETSVGPGGTLTGGRRTLLLDAPGNGNNGGVTLTANLTNAALGSTCIGGVAGADTGADRLYLQGNWTAGAYDQNPTARATFGTFKGAGEVIFIRENF
jgi:MSHA biogenesis protein MshQ